VPATKIEKHYADENLLFKNRGNAGHNNIAKRRRIYTQYTADTSVDRNRDVAVSVYVIETTERTRCIRTPTQRVTECIDITRILIAYYKHSYFAYTNDYGKMPQIRTECTYSMANGRRYEEFAVVQPSDFAGR